MGDPVAPHSLDAEQALLGSIFLDNDVLDDVQRIVPQGEYFYRGVHKAIYKGMLYLRKQGKPISWITAWEVLQNTPSVKAQGAEYLEELTANTPFVDTPSAVMYAEIVRDYAARRETINSTTALRRTAFDPTEGAQESLAAAIRNLQQVQERMFPAIGSKSATAEALDWYRSIADPDGGQTIFCGHPVVDEIAMGFNLGGLSQFIAPSGGGKTFFLHQLCMRIQRLYQTPCGMVQGEMRKSRLMVRQAVGAKGMMAAHSIRARRQEERDPKPGDLVEFDMAEQRINQLGELMYEVEVPRSMSISDVAECVRRLASNGCKFVIVDYLQRIHGGQREANADLKTVVHTLKDLSRNLDIHICCASQIPASSARDKDKTAWELNMWDAYGGGNAVQDFDMIATVFRPSKLKDLKAKGLKDFFKRDADKITVVKICKSRFGETEHMAYWMGEDSGEGLTIEPMNESMSTAFENICGLGRFTNDEQVGETPSES